MLAVCAHKDAGGMDHPSKKSSAALTFNLDQLIIAIILLVYYGHSHIFSKNI